MDNEYVNKITVDEIKSHFDKYLTEHTAYTVDFDSLDDAVNSAIQDVYSRVNDFEVLTQDMIDEQAENYDGYLDGAEVGDLVWGDNEMWVSQSNVEAWDYQNEESAKNQCLAVRDIESLVGDFLILDRLQAYNSRN